MLRGYSGKLFHHLLANHDRSIQVLFEKPGIIRSSYGLKCRGKLTGQYKSTASSP